MTGRSNAVAGVLLTAMEVTATAVITGKGSSGDQAGFFASLFGRGKHHQQRRKQMPYPRPVTFRR